MNEEKILVVVDLQNDFVTGSLGTKEAQNIIPAAIKRIHEYCEQDFSIFATMDTHTDNYLDTAEGQKLPVPHCIYGTWGWELVTEVANALGNAEKIMKPTFGSLELINRVKELRNISSIELLGLCTDICVVSNALLLKAAFPETKIMVNQKCCAGVTPESHESAIQTMISCQIDII